MNTKTRIEQQNQAQQRQMVRQKQRSKEPGQHPNKLRADQSPHEQERPETRLTR